MKNFLKKLSLAMAWIIGVLLLSLFLFVSYCTYEVGYKPYRGKKFSKEAWKEAREIYRRSYGISGKCAMYNDLVKNHLKNGMDINDIKNLLGSDNVLEYYCFSDNKEQTKCLHYTLGLCYASAWTRDHGKLMICFDKHNKTVAFGKAEDIDGKYCNKIEADCESGAKCKCINKEKSKSYDCDFEVERW